MTSTKTATISFDFDDTLAEYSSAGFSGYELVCIPTYLQLLKEYHALGCRCIILTARSHKDEHIDEIDQFLEQYGIEDAVSDIVFTNHQLKGPFAFALKVDMHYDDSPDHLQSVRTFGVKGINSKSLEEITDLV